MTFFLSIGERVMVVRQCTPLSKLLFPGYSLVGRFIAFRPIPFPVIKLLRRYCSMWVLKKRA